MGVFYELHIHRTGEAIKLDAPRLVYEDPANVSLIWVGDRQLLVSFDAIETYKFYNTIYGPPEDDLAVVIALCDRRILPKCA